MARRGGLGAGMTALRAALGAVAGGLEGYEMTKARQMKAQQDEEDRQMRQLALLNQIGFRPTGLVRQTPDVAAQNIVSDIGAEVPKPTLDTTMGRAFETAQQRGMGVKAAAPESFGAAQQKAFQASRQKAFNVAPEMGAIVRPDLPETPLRQAISAAEAPARKPILDSSRLGQFERAAAMQAANPETQMDVKGIGRLGFAPPETEEEKFQRELKKLEAQQDLIAKRTEEANARANRGYFAILKKAGEMEGLDFEDVKDIDLKSAYDEYKQTRSIEAAAERAQVAADAARGMETIVTGIDPTTGKPTLYQAPRGGGPLKSTTIQAPVSARAATGQEKTSLLATLPSVISAADRLNSLTEDYVDNIRAGALDAMNTANTTTGAPGLLARTAVAKLGSISKEESEYLQISNAVADAIGRATDVGVLSNFDVDRFRRQVMPTALDGAEAKRAKFVVLKGWANWLKNNRAALQAADRAYEQNKPLEQQGLTWNSEPPAGSMGFGEVMKKPSARDALSKIRGRK